MALLTVKNTTKILEFVGIQLHAVDVSMNMVVWRINYMSSFKNFSAAIQTIIDEIGIKYTYDDTRELDVLYETTKYQNNFLLLDFKNKWAYLHQIKNHT